MSKADKMFEELGYTPCEDTQYSKDLGNGTYLNIDFYEDSKDFVKTISKGWEVIYVRTTWDEVLAIYEKMKELGWISAGNDSCGTEWDLLQELVDKETPMKKTIKKGRPYCAKCSYSLLIEDVWEMSYCCACGHRIDWSQNV